MEFIFVTLVWLSTGYAGWRLLIYRFGRDFASRDNAMIFASFMLGPFCLWTAIMMEEKPKEQDK